MDLTERGGGATRHPWEVQRFEAYRRILADHGALTARRVLDVGAGDGWFSDRLSDHLADDATVTCWDINYDDNDLEPSRAGVVRTRDRPAGGHDLVLLLDVLEHIDDADEFLRNSLSPITRAGIPALVAVPAYQRLFSSHDEVLGHHRRYSRRQLLAVLDPWLDVIEDGSLFTSLLLPRAATVLIARRRAPVGTEHRPGRRPGRPHGVGEWSAGPVATATVNGVLAIDAHVGRFAGRHHVPLPGLSLWALGVVR